MDHLQNALGVRVQMKMYHIFIGLYVLIVKQNSRETEILYLIVIVIAQIIAKIVNDFIYLNYCLRIIIVFNKKSFLIISKKSKT